MFTLHRINLDLDETLHYCQAWRTFSKTFIARIFFIQHEIFHIIPMYSCTIFFMEITLPSDLSSLVYTCEPLPNVPSSTSVFYKG